jgi:hypothetical protein
MAKKKEYFLNNSKFRSIMKTFLVNWGNVTSNKGEILGFNWKEKPIIERERNFLGVFFFH